MQIDGFAIRKSAYPFVSGSPKTTTICYGDKNCQEESI